MCGKRLEFYKNWLSKVRYNSGYYSAVLCRKKIDKEPLFVEKQIEGEYSVYTYKVEYKDFVDTENWMEPAEMVSIYSANNYTVEQIKSIAKTSPAPELIEYTLKIKGRNKYYISKDSKICDIKFAIDESELEINLPQ